MTHNYSIFVWYSWGSGANPWGPEKDDQFSKPNHYDGMLEVVGVKSVAHMVKIQSGLTSAKRIAQGGHVSISLVSLQIFKSLHSYYWKNIFKNKIDVNINI
jgi:hypothetical protein